MEYNERERRGEEYCKLGYPTWYYKMGMDENDYKKMMMKKKKKMEEYHKMSDGHKMHGKKHVGGPEGFWGIHGMGN